MKGKDSIVVVVVVVIGFLAVAFMHLQRMAKVSEIISDEAEWDVRDSLSAAAQMKVVILQDGTVARYVSENGNAYSCDIQDTFSVPREEVRVELWSASDGKGIVYLKEPGVRPAYSAPDPAAATVLDLIYEEGCVPDTYPCLGLEDGWYKVRVGERPAFIEARYVIWDAVDSF